MEKTCPRCGALSNGIKEIKLRFGFNSKGTTNTYCKSCKREKDREYRQKRKENKYAQESTTKKVVNEQEEFYNELDKSMETMPITTIFVPTKDDKPEAIVKLNETVLKEMLFNLKQSGAIEIGVGVTKE